MMSNTKKKIIGVRFGAIHGLDYKEVNHFIKGVEVNNENELYEKLKERFNKTEYI